MSKVNVVVLVLSMCMWSCSQKGEPGPAGAQGAKGDRGESGAPGPRGADGAAIAGARIVVWVDANGAVIGPEAAYVDDAGVRWHLDRETGEVNLGTPLRLLFEAAGCAGEPLVAVPAPRVAFAAGIDGGVYVRPDDSLRAETRSAEYAFIGACVQSGGTFAVMPLGELRNVTPPSSPFVGPLRTEWR